MPLLPRPELNNIPTVTHGGPNYSELESMGLSADHMLDFSVCCNPYPPPAAVRKSLQGLKINLYPDSQSLALRLKLSQKLGVPVENLLAGNGSTELIRLIALAYFNKGDRVLIPCPTYSEYETASRIAGAEVINYQMEWQKTESETMKGLLAAVRKYRPKAVFLCNPNNPTGQFFNRKQIETLISNLGDALLILDEAYINFVDEAYIDSLDEALPNSLDEAYINSVAKPHANSADDVNTISSGEALPNFVNESLYSQSLIDLGNIIFLRSLTKDYGLAGLRLGYAAAGVNIINTLRLVCPPWNVNSGAQQAGIAVLDAEAYLIQCQKRIRQAKLYLIRELNKLGLTTLPSKTNFILLKVMSGKTFRQSLMKEGIIVRDCASFGLPGYVRIASRTFIECRKLIGTINRLQEKGELNAGV